MHPRIANFLIIKITSNYVVKISLSKSRIITKQVKLTPTNENGKPGSREKVGDNTSESQEGDRTDYRCNNNEASRFFYGTHETEISEGEEVELHKHIARCEKNPGHKQFVPVKDFSINHLPEGHNDNDLVEYIKAVAYLTVRVFVKVTSIERPNVWPNTDQPYPFYDKRGSDDKKIGTGMVRYVTKLTEEVIKEYIMGTCKCNKCQHSDTPSKVWGKVRVYTARHVVFDDHEARHTSCRLFYDIQDSPLVTLDGWTVEYANIEEDWCVLECVTCDLDLLDKLEKMVRHWFELSKKVNSKCNSFRNKDQLIFIASHPHGCPKQISVGHWINKYIVSGVKTKYTYTTCTCPGSSGAYVHSLGNEDGWWYYDRHVHSGVNLEGINFSGTGRDLR